MPVLSSVVMAMVLIGQAPSATPTRERHTVVIEYLGGWGLSEGCPGGGGYDRLTGVVQRVMPGDQPGVAPWALPAGPPQATSTPPPGQAALAARVAAAVDQPGLQPCTGIPCLGVPPELPDVEDSDVVYSGVLSRDTDVTLCETKETTAGTEWCTGRQTGNGHVLVTIKIDPGDGGGGMVALEPLPDTTATVSGRCDTLDNAAEVARYKDSDQIQFETLPAGALVPTTTYRQSSPSHASGRPEYTLKVDPLPPPAPRP
jgi:hypothetical protein